MSNKSRGLYLKGLYRRLTKQWETGMGLAHGVAQSFAREQLRESIAMKLV